MQSDVVYGSRLTCNTNSYSYYSVSNECRYLYVLCKNLILEEFLIFMILCFNHLLKLTDQLLIPVPNIPAERVLLNHPQVLLKRRYSLRMVIKDGQDLLLKQQCKGINLNIIFLRLSY